VHQFFNKKSQYKQPIKHFTHVKKPAGILVAFISLSRFSQKAHAYDLGLALLGTGGHACVEANAIDMLRE
jgi:hypothetical protein